MRSPRLYLAADLESGVTVVLPEDRLHYLTRVLRLEPDGELVVFNGQGGYYPAQLIRDNRSHYQLQLGIRQEEERESPLIVHLALGLSRGERMDFALQKATELGVASFYPLITERSVVNIQGDRLERRMAHWQGIVSGACEQCGRNRLPLLHPLQTLARFLDTPAPGIGLLLDPREGTALKDLTPSAEPITLLVGPEGGLAPQERDSARCAGFRGLRLGPRVLRTETAPLAALAALQALWGDMG